AYQPIVEAKTSHLFGYEALLRSAERLLPTPTAVLDAAKRLGRLTALGHRIWERAAAAIEDADDTIALFVNVHADDLVDPWLLDPASPLARRASRVVLEVTERASLDRVTHLRRATM